MGFLDKLRSTGVFRQDPARERPFGMPRIDNGDYMSIIRDFASPQRIIHHESGINRGMARRIGSPALTNSNVNNTKKNVVYGGTEGFSPMQQVFMRDRAQRESNERQDMLRAQDLEATQNLMRQRRDDSEFARNREFGQEKEMAEINLDKAVRLREVDKKAQAERDKFNAEARRGDIIAREEAQAKFDAKKPQTAKDKSEAYALAAQQLKNANPVLGALIDIEDGIVNINAKANPEQRKRIDALLKGEKYQAPVYNADLDAKKTGPAIKRQRNSKGQERISKDGGKTWEMVKK